MSLVLTVAFVRKLWVHVVQQWELNVRASEKRTDQNEEEAVLFMYLISQLFGRGSYHLFFLYFHYQPWLSSVSQMRPPLRLSVLSPQTSSPRPTLDTPVSDIPPNESPCYSLTNAFRCAHGHGPCRARTLHEVKVDFHHPPPSLIRAY